MGHELKLGVNSQRRKIQSNMVREWEKVPAPLQQCLRELCRGERKWPLFLHGPTGTGKSRAALCLVDRVEKAEFWLMPELDRYVREVKQGRAEWYDCGRGGTISEKGWWTYLARVPLLVLDDVGLRESSSDYQMETLYLALEARGDKPLICTSNLDEDGIQATYNERIRSRMCCGTQFRLMGADRRYEDQTSPTAKVAKVSPKG